MPRIVVKGIEKESLKKISGELFDVIAEIINRPKEAFTLDLVESVAIESSKEIKRVHVEIGWKERPKEVCTSVANAVEKVFKKENYEHLIIYFKNIDLENEYQFKK